MQNNIVSVPKRRPRTKRIELGMLALAVFLLIVPVPQVRGQAVANAQISGVVQDPSGAAVPGARVTGTQTSTRLARVTVSGADGTYLLPDLAVGPYTLEVQATGFDTYIQTGIVLQVNDTPTVNVKLRVGQVSQHVEVRALLI